MEEILGLALYTELSDKQ